MNIPTPLARDLKQYLKVQAQQGDPAAQSFLVQLEQLEEQEPADLRQAGLSAPPGVEEIGC